LLFAASKNLRGFCARMSEQQPASARSVNFPVRILISHVLNFMSVVNYPRSLALLFNHRAAIPVSDLPSTAELVWPK
jgi:hypothetical protein